MRETGPHRLNEGSTRICCPEIVRTQPVEGCVNPVILRDHVRLSTSVSFVITSIRNDISSEPVKLSSFAVGASFTQVIANDPVATLLVAPEASVTW